MQYLVHSLCTSRDVEQYVYTQKWMLYNAAMTSATHATGCTQMTKDYVAKTSCKQLFD